MLIFSADNFFINKTTGVYEFNPGKLKEAHGSCIMGFALALFHKQVKHVTIMRGCPGSGKSTWIKDNAAELDTVIDNTNPTAVDVAPYAALASAYDVPMEVVTLMSDPEIAAARNVHGVPYDAVLKIAKKVEDNSNMNFWKHKIVYQQLDLTNRKLVEELANKIEAMRKANGVNQ